jgi:glycosyltransferase involved in cell wall biosynthesis/GT2 family glycosyltransferase
MADSRFENIMDRSNPNPTDGPARQPKPRSVKPIAFYLPQFHPTPENDAWWGKGFTEWNNVTSGRPFFLYHDQPRRPERLGYYDLRNPEIPEAQAALAREYGVYGFCYYYYWFGGRKLLNQPIEQMLSSGKPDFPFCICWANENWSRNWDGQNDHVLLAQEYSLESNLAFIREAIAMMRDPRYIRHEGKPVLTVYRISIIPDWLSVARMWRAECRKTGIGEIHLCAVRFGLEPLQGQPREHGLDAYVLFPPHESEREDLKSEVVDLQQEFGGEIFSYDAVVKGDLNRFNDGYPWPVHRGAMMSWDNTARRNGAARIFHGATPLRLRFWLREILRQEDAHNPSNESLLFINAWNEWAEGTILEPDQRFGTGYLEAVKSALTGYSVPAFGQDQTQAPASAPGLVARSNMERLLAARAFDQNGQAQWVAGRVTENPGNPTILLTAHISGHQLYGGERSLLDVLGALKALGFNVVVTLPSGNNHEYINQILEDTLGLYILPYPQWRQAREPIERLILCFRKILLDHNIAAVHANTIVQIEPLLAAQRFGIKTVVHARELITLDDGLCEQIGLSPAEIIARVLQISDFVIGNSRITTQTFSRPGKAFCVYNAISIEAFEVKDRPAGPLRFGIVSSNLPKKGVGDFIAAVRLLGDSLDNVEFVVIGPKRPQLVEWERDIEEGHLPKALRFLGYRETPQAAMDELDVLLNLSHFAESFGRTVAEAGAAGKPAIAYHWGALPEVVDDGETGILVGYRDIAGLAAAIERLAADPDRVEEMGRNARKRVEALFSQDALRKALQAAYDVILPVESTATQPARVRASTPTVIIPVYNAYAAFEKCLEALQRHTPGLKALIVDDASTDPRIAELLAESAGDMGITVITNATNIGYTRSINLAITAAGDSDIVLLNSDAIVTPNWLDGLQLAALQRPDIGTVTAMSDNAGAFSFPEQGEANPLPAWIEPDEFARTMIQATGQCEPVEVPTGSGFCMYIKRALLNEIGLFDEAAFPRGYGEENDFCMRAMESGWTNMITPWSYVFHIRNASFGKEKDALITSGVAEVIRRYPDYAGRVGAAFGSESMHRLREAARRPYT